MSYSETIALKALSEILDPRTGRDIVSAGMLGDLTFEEGVLRVLILICLVYTSPSPRDRG